MIDSSNSPTSAVIILAAGSGTRMKSSVPKMLHPVCGRSMLGHAMHAAAGVDPARIVVVIGHQRELVGPAAQDVAADLGVAVSTAIQHEQNGTGDAVRCGLDQLDGFEGSVIVSTSDVPLLDSETLKGLLDHHTQLPRAAVTVLTSVADDPTGYGRIVRTPDGEITDIVEHKDASTEELAIKEVNSGVYAFDADTLRNALTQLSTDNSQGELYLTDVIAIARREDKVVRAHRIHDASRVAGVNDRVQLSTLASEMNRRLCEQAMRNGATIVDPDTTRIDVRVQIGRDVTILPGTQLQGSTIVASGSTVGPDSTLINTVVGENARVTRTHAIDAEIGAGAEVGPFAYLRPAAQLGEETKIGAFVEIKKSTIGPHSKVPHLTYVGDAEIGHHSNIGASSVFVNYDGVNKHRTVIGDHVRTGSDTMFIAPVRVGDGAYSGAGTVIKDDVPPGALAVSGGRQRNIEGWVAKNRPGTAAADAASASQGSGIATTHREDGT